MSNETEPDDNGATIITVGVDGASTQIDEFIGEEGSYLALTPDEIVIHFNLDTVPENVIYVINALTVYK